MKKALIMLLPLLALIFLPVVVGAQDMAAGAKIFVDSKCNTCHSVTAAKIEKKMASSKGSDLSNVGSTHDAAWLTKWINKEVDLDGKKHMASTKLSDADMKTLTEWLASQKTK